MNLEDETGMLNVIVQRHTWQVFAKIARTSAALLIRGRLQRAEGVTSLVADHLAPLSLRVKTTSRDFR